MLLQFQELVFTYFWNGAWGLDLAGCGILFYFEVHSRRELERMSGFVSVG